MSDEFQYFNKSQTLEHFSGDEDILEMLISDFLDNKDSLVTSIEKAYNEKDFEELECSAHTLKGILRNFFTEDLIGRAYRIELMGKNKNPEGFVQAYSNLKQGVDVICDELSRFSVEMAA